MIRKINKIIEYLKEKDTELIGACHCTGKQGETMLSHGLEGSLLIIILEIYYI